MENLHSRRTYDYRIQEAVCETGDRDLFPELNIPRSTIRSWIHRAVPEVISCELATDDRAELTAEIEKLRCRTALLGAVVGLLIAVLRASKVQLDYERIPDGDAKKILLRSIERARKVLPLNAALRITHLSASRYHGWCRAEAGCDLEDRTSCPRVVPTRLTPDETENMRKMVESDDHRHMSLRARLFTLSELARSSLHHRRGIGLSERQAGGDHELVSIRRNPRSESEQRLPANSFIWT
jgi:hypothetical protein